LELFHCLYDADVERPGRYGARSVAEDIRDIVFHRRRQLEVNAEQLAGRGIRVRASARWDYPPYEGIVRQVLRHEPSLLVAESTSRGRLARRFLSYNDFRLIETCPCPLLLVKTPRPYSEHPTLVAAVDPFHVHDKPAVLDDSIVEASWALSRALSAKLLLLHVRKPWPAPTPGAAPEGATGDEMWADYAAHTESAVRELARRHGVGVEGANVVEGEVAEVLPDWVLTHSADIVVLGAASRSRLKRILLGHTSERLLDSLDCDVLLVKPPGFQTSVSRRSPHRIAAELPGRYIL